MREFCGIGNEGLSREIGKEVCRNAYLSLILIANYDIYEFKRKSFDVLWQMF